jgi:hypothetical protein
MYFYPRRQNTPYSPAAPGFWRKSGLRAKSMFFGEREPKTPVCQRENGFLDVFELGFSVCLSQHCLSQATKPASGSRCKGLRQPALTRRGKASRCKGLRQPALTRRGKASRCKGLRQPALTRRGKASRCKGLRQPALLPSGSPNKPRQGKRKAAKAQASQPKPCAVGSWILSQPKPSAVGSCIQGSRGSEF